VIIACTAQDIARSGHVSVFLNTTSPGVATPAFAAPQRFPIAHANVISVAAADFNHDNKIDIVVANSDGASVSVLLNTADQRAITASFAAPVELPTALAPIAVIAIDLNGDGKPDVATANKTSQSLSVMANLMESSATEVRFANKLDLA